MRRKKSFAEALPSGREKRRVPAALPPESSRTLCCCPVLR